MRRAWLTLGAVTIALAIFTVASACALVTSSMPSRADATAPTLAEFKASLASIKSRAACEERFGEPVCKNVFDDFVTRKPAGERWVYERVARQRGCTLDTWLWWNVSGDEIVRVQFYDPDSGEVLR